MIPYTVAPVWIKVSKAEFEEFIQTYPRPLSRGVSMICEPPEVSYYDPQLADLVSFSTVAYTYWYENNLESVYYVPQSKRVYNIMENYEECFANRVVSGGGIIPAEGGADG